MYVVLDLNDVIGRSIFVIGGNNEPSYGALNVVDFSVFS